MTESNVPPSQSSADREREAALGAFECRALVELVTDYLDHAMDPDERGRLERHLAACDGCQIYVEQFRQVIAATGRLEPNDVSDDAIDALREVYRRYRRG
ncbi:MAG TPA: zf-HC2 domain-containing protein [Candidatus Limnocylindria bacterium]